MVPVGSAAIVPALVSHCCFLVLCLVFVYSFAPSALAPITYDRQTLTLQVTHWSLTPLSLDLSWPTVTLRRGDSDKGHAGPKSRRHQGKQYGVRNRLRTWTHHPLLLSILLANVQFLENKLNDLRARIKYHRDIQDCNILILSETWLTPNELTTLFS